MCFVLQVLILQAFHALHPDLSQTQSGEHYDSEELLLYVLSISSLAEDNWSNAVKKSGFKWKRKLKNKDAP